ncbi:MAG: pyridoxine 5'-phosphate synthase [Thermonemataceae bacterium]
MARLSVNINKFATLRNARGGNNPDVIKAAVDAEQFGAQGITVHPRPDERHIRYEDVRQLSKVVTTEFNIEGNPKEQKFVELVLEVRPTQVTLVPDTTDVLTSDAGWDTKREATFLKEMMQTFQQAGIRTSIFVDPVTAHIEGAAEVGTDRIELYTEAYAKAYKQKPAEEAAKSYQEAAVLAHQLGLGINAGHDLDLNNLSFFKQQVPHLLEVSIGHALICDALYLGFENTIQLYLRALA